MTSHDVQSTRRVALNWPTGDYLGTPMDTIEAAFADWVAEARRRGCPPDARVGFIQEPGLNRPALIVQWDASQDVTPPGTAPADSVTVEWDSDASTVLDWIRDHGYEAAFMDPNSPTTHLRAPVFFAKPGEPARMAFNGDALTWDGEKITVTRPAP